MPNRRIAFAVLGLLFFAALPSGARADQRAVQCSIDWSKLRGSKDRGALDGLAKRCSGTEAGDAASARIAKLWPRVVVKPDRPKPDKPPQPYRPPRQLSYAELHERGLRNRYSVTMYQSARSDFSAACFSGAIGQACHDLGLAYAIPVTGPLYYTSALIAYREGCRLDNRAACVGLVSYSAPKSQGGLVVADYRYGLQRLCDDFADGNYCNSLAASLTTVEHGIDYARAFKYAERACSFRNASGCDNVRVFHSSPVMGQPKNLALAMSAFDRAITFGHGPPNCATTLAQGCLDLANHYWNNARAGTDAKRLALHSGACSGGIAVACGFAAGTIWLSNAAVGNYSQVRPFYEQACSANIAVECYNLSQTLKDARFGPVDFPRAAQMADKACRGGEAKACPAPKPYSVPKM